MIGSKRVTTVELLVKFGNSVVKWISRYFAWSVSFDFIINKELSINK